MCYIFGMSYIYHTFVILTRNKILRYVTERLRCLMFYDVFEKLCRENGYTPSGACVAMGRSKNLAAKWKNTGANPSAEVLHEIANFFGVSVDYLLGKEKATGGDGIEARQDAFDRTEMRVLFDAAKDVPASKIYEVVALLEKFKEESQER